MCAMKQSRGRGGAGEDAADAVHEAA